MGHELCLENEYWLVIGVGWFPICQETVEPVVSCGAAMLHPRMSVGSGHTVGDMHTSMEHAYIA